VESKAREVTPNRLRSLKFDGNVRAANGPKTSLNWHWLALPYRVL
jgi:hypothetical protein